MSRARAVPRAGLRIGGALALALLTAAAWGRTFTDAAGRTHEVPQTIERVYAAGHPASILLYTLAPEMLVGWSRPLTPGAEEFMPPRYARLPELGALTGRGGSANIERVLATRAQVILDYGTLDPTYVSLADAVQAQTGIPYVLLDGALERIPETYRLLGGLVGRAGRAARLAARAEEILAAARAPGPQAAPSPRVYYGRGPDGLQTALPGSINAELLGRAGVRNVAQGPGRGLADVSVEQVLGWRPDAVLTIDPVFYQGVGRDPAWRALEAVREGRVYLAPGFPFPWFDRPPSVNRLVGLPWLTHIFHGDPDRATLRRQVRAFYALFYHHHLSEQQLDELLRRAGVGP